MIRVRLDTAPKLGATIIDYAAYHRFTQMLLRGGELDCVRVLGPRAIELMTSNHLPGHRRGVYRVLGGP